MRLFWHRAKRKRPMTAVPRMCFYVHLLSSRHLILYRLVYQASHMLYVSFRKEDETKQSIPSSIPAHSNVVVIDAVHSGTPSTDPFPTPLPRSCQATPTNPPVVRGSGARRDPNPFPFPVINLPPVTGTEGNSGSREENKKNRGEKWLSHVERRQS